MTTDSKRHSELVDAARASVDLIGEGDWTPQDTYVFKLCDVVDGLEEQLEAVEGRVQSALRELERASDVLANRTGIIGNVDLILRGESSPASDPRGEWIEHEGQKWWVGRNEPPPSFQDSGPN